MILNLGGPLVSSHAALYPLLPHVGGSLLPPRLALSAGLHLNAQHHSSVSIGSRRRRTRSNSASSGPRLLHPSGSLPEGVPSSLFKLQPPTPDTPKEYPPQTATGGGSGVPADGTVTAVTLPAVEEATNALDVRLVEETDLPDISALLAEVRKRNVPTAVSTCFHVVFGAPASNSRLASWVCPHVIWPVEPAVLSLIISAPTSAYYIMLPAHSQ